MPGGREVSGSSEIPGEIPADIRELKICFPIIVPYLIFFFY